MIFYIPDPVYAAITIPLDFPGTGPDATLPMLTALRISAVVLSGLMWVADQSGATAYHPNGRILDASFNLPVSYSPPVTGVRSLDILSFDATERDGFARCVARVRTNFTCVLITFSSQCSRCRAATG